MIVSGRMDGLFRAWGSMYLGLERGYRNPYDRKAVRFE